MTVAPDLAESTGATAPVLYDDAVFLDAYRMSDVDAMQVGADPEIVRWINEGVISTVEQDRTAVTGWETSWRTGGAQRTWAVRDHRTGDLAGGCELRLQSPGRRRSPTGSSPGTEATGSPCGR